jgi:hypothetical protein
MFYFFFSLSFSFFLSQDWCYTSTTPPLSLPCESDCLRLFAVLLSFLYCFSYCYFYFLFLISFLPFIVCSSLLLFLVLMLLHPLGRVMGVFVGAQRVMRTGEVRRLPITLNVCSRYDSVFILVMLFNACFFHCGCVIRLFSAERWLRRSLVWITLPFVCWIRTDSVCWEYVYSFLLRWWFFISYLLL